MNRYAAGTEVSSERSRGEIERTLARYGATAFMYGWDGPRAVIGFKAHNRLLRFVLPMPEKESYRRTPARRAKRSNEQTEAAWEQACRQSWRALALVVKAKLEAVQAGIVTFEEEFLAHIVIPGTGQTMAERALPLIQQAYETGAMPPLLPHIPS